MLLDTGNKLIEGWIIGGKINGKARVIAKNGEVYIGEFKDN